MIGDKLIFLPEHKEKARKIMVGLELLEWKPKTVICIGGCSGSGKSEIARILRDDLKKECERKCKILSLDDYYRSSWKERNASRKTSGIIGVGEINWDGVRDTITHFRSNECFDIWLIDPYTGSRDRILCDAFADTLIIEGLYALYLHNEADYLVHLKGHYTDENNKAFRRQRGKEKIDQFRLQVLETEQNEVDNLAHNYNIIV